MDLRHQVFWNIPLGPVVFYSLNIIAWAVLFFAVSRRVKLWRKGKGVEPPSNGRGRPKAFLKYFLFDLLLHRRFFQDVYPAIIHFSLFTGFFLLFLGTVAVAVDHYVVAFLTGRVYLVVSLVLDMAGLVLLLGVALAAFRRYVQRPARLDNRTEDWMSLLWLALMAVSGFLVEGARLAVPEPGNSGQQAAAWMPVGTPASRLFAGLSLENRELWHRALWWFHAGLGLAALVYVAVYFNRLIHILVSTASVYFRPLGYKGALRPVNLETDQKIGAAEVLDFSWKHLLEMDACTRCGRCQDNCPAYLSRKVLSPRKVVLDLKGDWLERAGTSSSEAPHSPLELIPRVIQEQVIWDCTTCLACQQQCPVYIQPMYKIMEMRRHQAMMLGHLPPSAQAAVQNMQKRGHPWSGSQFMRLRDDWTREVPVRKIKPVEDSRNGGEKVKTLLFVGCTGALVDRNVAVTLSLVRVLNKAGLEFGVLGGSEACCGDPARRLGYELIYQTNARANIASFKEHGVERIITICPHCYNTFKNEYPEMGGNFSVFHHSEILADLLQRGVLRKKSGQDSARSSSYTYHDACYLGRYNDVFAAPRRALHLALGKKPVEMPLSKSKSFCCGGGGAHAWLEEVGGKRIGEMRLEQALSTGAGVVATACPYCLQMLENAAEKKEGKDGKAEVMIMDLAEIVEHSLSS